MLVVCDFNLPRIVWETLENARFIPVDPGGECGICICDDCLNLCFNQLNNLWQCFELTFCKFLWSGYLVFSGSMSDTESSIHGLNVKKEAGPEGLPPILFRSSSAYLTWLSHLLIILSFDLIHFLPEKNLLMYLRMGAENFLNLTRRWYWLIASITLFFLNL